MQADIDHSDRFISRPRFGDTVNTLGLKFMQALDQHSQPISLPFRSYGETFGQVVRRYVAAMQLEHPLSTQFVVEYLQSKELVGDGKRLETYKGDIEEGRPRFRVFPMDTHQMIQIEEELRSLIVESTIHNPALLLPANNITVLVRKPNSQVIELTVNKYSPLKVLRLEVCRKEGLEAGEFSLIFVGKKLEEDEETLEDLGIEDQTMIMLAMVVKLGCFAPGSLISLLAGSSRPVGELKIGDEVASLREEDWVLQGDEVVGVHRSMVNCYLRVSLSDGSSIECTPNHKFRCNGRWMSFTKEEDAPRLREGDRLLRADLSSVSITSIERVTTEPVQFVHISTKNNHNFLLNGVASHNMEVRLLNTANGEEFSVNIAESDTIGLLKLRAEAIMGVAKQQLMIVLNKVELRDHESIADYIQDIKNCHRLEVVQMAEHTIVVTRLKTKREHRFKLDKKQEVRELKKQIEAETQILRDHQILILNNVEMLNAQLIGEFELHRNFNRVSLVEVEEEQLSVSKMMRFQLKKMLYVRVQGNDYLRLNYFSLREMRVEQFLTAFVPDARPTYALLVGPHLLRPTHWIKDVEQMSVFNSEEINCYVIRSYQRLAFNPSLNAAPEFTLPAAGLDATAINELRGKEAGVKLALGKCDYVKTLKEKFGEGLAAFYQPIQAYSRNSSSLLLEIYLEKFACSATPSELQGFTYCSALVRSLLAMPAFIGVTHRLLPGLRFRQFYEKRGDTICIQSFLSTQANPASLPPPPARNYTILHAKSLRGREVGIITGVKDEVVFMPLSYFFVERIEVRADFDEVWVVEVPTPLSFDRDVFMWVDDQPDSRENRAICDLLDLSRYELVQLTSTGTAEYWMKEFGWIVKWLGRGIRVMSDMKRAQGLENAMVEEAGINLVELFHNDLGYTAPIFIFCKNVSAGRKAMQARKIAPGRIQKITSDEFELITFLTSQ